jgi:lipopolysaccharide transport protein LptA
MTAALLAAGAALGAPARESPSLQLNDTQPIQLVARATDFDYKNNTLVFYGVRIAQGGLAIEADTGTATGLDFKDSHWVFKGNVRVTMPDGALASSEAHIDFAANLIANARITGTPATFEQKRDNGMARGHALTIEYQPAAGTVRLSDDAWLSDGNNDITSRTLVYYLRDQRVVANPDEQGSQPVRITINPKKADSKPEPKPEPKPEANSDAKPGADPKPNP